MTIASGGETQINAVSQDKQQYKRVAVLEDGGWVVTWMSVLPDNSNAEILQQAYNADGTKRGVETVVNTNLFKYQWQESVAALKDGGWVVTWTSMKQDLSASDGVYQQAYNADGTARGVETQLSTPSIDYEKDTAITALSDGGWIASWISYPSVLSGAQQALYFQAYNADGTQRGVQVQADSDTSYKPTSQQIVELSDGGWVVTWISDLSYMEFNVRQQAFNADGTARGTATNISNSGDGARDLQVTVLQDGGWLVTWRASNSASLHYLAYDADGTARGPATEISGTTGSNLNAVALADGGWALTWTSSSSGWPTVYHIFQQVYDADGTTRGGQTEVNTSTLSSNLGSQGAALSDGGWVILWSDVGHIYQQAYNADGTADGAELVFTITSSRMALDLKITALPDNGWVVSWTNEDVYQRTFWKNDAPTVTGPIGAGIATEDQPFSGIILDKFVDADALDTLTYTATMTDGSALPDWLTFDPATRKLSGTPGNGDTGFITIKVTATDKAGASVSAEYALWIDQVNDAPTVEGSIPDRTRLEDRSFSFTVAEDVFVDIDPGDQITYSATLSDGSDLPEWLAFDPATLTFSGTPDGDDVGPITVRVTATDLAGEHVSTDFTLTINDKPVVINEIAAQTATEDQAFSFTVPAGTFDDQILNTLAYGASGVDGSPLPEWLSFDPATLTFSGTPTDGDVAVLQLWVTATDLGGASVSTPFELTVRNVNDAPTVANPVGAKQATEDLAFTYTVPAGTFADADAYVGDTLTYTAKLANGSALPSWLQFNATTRTFSGTPANANVGEITVRLTAKDGSGATVSTDFKINVANTNDAPTLPTGRTASTLENTALTLDVLSAAQDVDVGDSLTITSASVRSGFGSVFIRDGKLIYDPTTAPNQNIAAGDTRAVVIRYTVSDGKGGTATADIAVTVKGVSPDIFKGDTGNDTLIGSIHGDKLYGYAGNDTLDGNTGADRMEGGAGNDTYVVDNTGDVIVEKAGEGTDLVKSSIGHVLDANVENLTLTGAAKINGVGNTLANALTGNSADNILDGKAGADRMTGGAGNDTYVVDNTGDVVVETASQGADLVKSAISYTLGLNVENLTLTGTAATGIGNTLANVITGNASANTLDGKAGNDTLKGEAGNDRLIGGAGADKLYGGSGADTFVFALKTDTTVAASGRDTLFDFSSAQGDRIDLSAMDASEKTSGNQTFLFIGTDAFHKKAGELRYGVKSGDAYIYGDVDGDGMADFAILIDAVVSLKASDFLL